MGIHVPVPIMAAVISSITAALVSWLITKTSRREKERAELLSFITQINLIAIDHPILEDDDFCAHWPANTPPDESDMRYDNYCCLVFNLLERMWKHFRGNRGQIESLFGVSEMVRRHKGWWRHRENRYHNLGGYDLGFIRYIDSVLKEASCHSQEKQS